MSAPTLLHRHGGEITNVTHVGHDTYKGVAEWFFIGDIKWQDGSESKERQIPPTMLCHDDTPESKARVHSLLDQLNAYLHECGEWLEKPKKKRGLLVHWESPTTSGRRIVK